MDITNSINYLNTIFGYNNVLPDAPVSYSNRVGLNGSNCRYIAPKKPVKPENKEINANNATMSESVVLKIINKSDKPISANEMAKKTKWTRNHCSILMGSLFKKGKIRRLKEYGHGTRWYIYERLNNAAS